MLQTNSHQTLAICMIVKNEAAILARCLQSIDGLANEIIVVDTGSKDETVAIAESFGAKVIQSDWRDDFSYSRNISISQASSTWILWLDADDVVPASSLPLIASLQQEKPDKVFGFIVKNEKPGNTGSEFVQARMFPNRKDIYFERRIHEQMMLSALRIGMKLVETSVVVEHHGYAEAENVKIKAQRNVSLLLAEWETSEPDIVRAIEIADSYFNLEQYVEAQKWYSTVINMPESKTTFAEIASQAYLGLGSICNKQEQFADAITFFNHSLALIPNRPDVLFSLAVAQDLSKDFKGAIQSLLAIISTASSTLRVSIDFREAKIKAFLRLEHLLLGCCRNAELLSIARDAVIAFPERPEILNMAGRVYYQHRLYKDALLSFEKSLTYNTMQNCEAYIGLCYVYCFAKRKDHAIATMENIRPLFVLLPLYWAFYKILRGTLSQDDIPPLVKKEDIEKEVEVLTRVFGEIG